MADVKLNTLPQSTSPTSTQDLLLFDESTNAGQRINYNTLADVILAKLTSKTYTVGGGTQTLISAIDALNSNSFTNPTTLTTSHDMNSIYTPGIYRQCGTDMPLHSPYAQFGGSVDTFANASITVTKARGDADTIQIWTSANSRYTYIRSQVGRANTWSSWLLQPTRNEVDALNSNTYQYKGGTSCTSNTSLNSYTTPGTYYAVNATIANSITDKPSTQLFKLVVDTFFGSSTTFLYQYFYEYSNNMDVYARRSTDGGSSWSEWVRQSNGVTMTSNSSANLAAVVAKAGNYILSWTYPEDASAYYFAFVHKADGANPVINVIANNKLDNGITNTGGTIVTKYNNNGVSGVVCNAYYLG